jgi:hypothetical protein
MNLLLMWKSLAMSSRRPAPSFRGMSESIGVFFSMGFNRLRRETRIALAEKTSSNRAMATGLMVR